MDERHRELQRPPEMGQLRRTAEAQALTLRAQVRTAMRLRGWAMEDIATQARLAPAELAAFLDGAAIHPRWQEKLARWISQTGLFND